MQRNRFLLDYHLPKWKIYCTLEDRVVCYSLLIKQKREFQQFIDQLGNQVSFQNRISSCYIIDKIHSTVDRKNINIYIFDGSAYCKILQLNISIPKRYLKSKIHLLIHLGSKNNAVSKLEDQCMYIKCNEGQIWKTFYNFFEFLFQKSSENVIGVQFYTPLISKYLIAKELSFLLSPSSRSVGVNTRQTLDITSISKPSSSCALIKTCPKNCIKPIGLLKNRITSTKNDPKTIFDLQLQQRPSCSTTLKRKSINSENDIMVKTLKVKHEFCKKVLCPCHERNKWKIFKQFYKQPTINYTEILKAGSMLQNSKLNRILFNQPEKSHSFNSLKAHQNSAFEIVSHEKTNLKLGFTKDMELLLKSSHQIIDIASETELGKNTHIQNEFEQSSKLFMSKTDKNLISYKSNTEIGSDSSDNHCKTNILASYNKKLFSKDKLDEVGKKYCADSSNILIGDECKEMILQPKGFNLASESNSDFLHVSSVAFEAVTSKEYKSTCKWPIESPSTCVSKAIMPTTGFQPVFVNQPMGFLTAAGKSLNVSEKAFLVAQKMFEEVCSQEVNVLGDMAENGILPSTSVSKKPAYPGVNYLENEFNSDLADKFFEEIPFDDKEVVTKPKENFVQVSNLNSVKPQVGKVRKSLGGRRSLKPYTLQK